jgi:BlaI family penicillinase repressor
MVEKNSYLWCMDKRSEHQQVEPTKSELEILQVLWEIGPATVRTVNDELLKKKEVNYSTTLKFMQIMAEKGLLNRDDSKMKHIYSSAEPAEKAKAHLLDKFVDSMYKGSAGKLVLQLLGNKNTSRQDLQDIKELIKKLEKE